MERYFNEASKRLWQAELPRNRKEEDLGIILSLENVMEIKAIYQDMLTMSPPKLHQEIDMSDELYKMLLKVYIEACDATINTTQSNYPDRDQLISFEEVNKLLAKIF